MSENIVCMRVILPTCPVLFLIRCRGMFRSTLFPKVNRHTKRGSVLILTLVCQPSSLAVASPEFKEH